MPAYSSARRRCKNRLRGRRGGIVVLGLWAWRFGRGGGGHMRIGGRRLWMDWSVVVSAGLDFGKVETYSQKLPARLMCNQPASTPPNANPRFVGMRIEPADAGDQPRTAIA